MALSADQKATLELILARGQSYADLCDFLDASEAEVRERARAALSEIGGSDPDRNAALTDFILGQADPIARADAVRHLREDAADHRLAGDLVAKLRVLIPDADLPRLPAEPRGGRFLRRDPASTGETQPAPAASGGGPGLSRSQSRLVVALGAGAVLLVAVILGVTGAFGGDSDPSPAPAEETEEAEPLGDIDDFMLDAPGVTVLRGPVDLEAQAAEGEDPNEVSVSLSAVGEGEASGEATFGLTQDDSVYVDLQLEDLDPAPEGETYVLWLMLSRQSGWPLTPVEVSPAGSFDERLAIPVGLLSLVAQMEFVAVERTANDDLAELIEGAVGGALEPGGAPPQPQQPDEGQG